jgi:hypothetical protein
MESVYHIVAIRVNETSWAHVWRLRFRYLGTGYDILKPAAQKEKMDWNSSTRSSRLRVAPVTVPVVLWSLPLFCFTESHLRL